jgi:pyrroline-5-carboxylate reductase
MKTGSIGFIGGGRITRIFLQAFRDSGREFGKIAVYDPDPDQLGKLETIHYHIKTDSASMESAARCDIVFLAVHPPVMMDTLSGIRPFLSNESIVVSLCPKITIEKISGKLMNLRAIARVNPGAPGIISQGINPVAFSGDMNAADRKHVLTLLDILGSTPEVPERKLEAYAIISAMGPTYFWFQMLHLKSLAVSFGMDEKEAGSVITEMIKGTANTLFKSGMQPEDVMDLVPVKPLGEYEETIKQYYTEKLNGIHEKIRP